MIDGNTRLFAILGDPIAQVRAPSVLNPIFAARGLNAVLVPIEVPRQGFDALMAGFKAARNWDGLVITVPHKVAVMRHLDLMGPQTARVGSANLVRREADGRLCGDITDGLGLVNAMRAKGGEPNGRSALVVGSGGVGAAIAGALLEAGAKVTLTDSVAGKAEELAARLGATAGKPDPRGHQLVINATPLGMRADDPLPVDASLLTSDQFVADVVTKPPLTPLLKAAQARGCRTSDGVEMVDGHAALMADFLTAGLNRPR
jgi:shikimate dehydrogenase